MFSIVFQGYVGPSEVETIERSSYLLKSVFPEAEIIVSCWTSNKMFSEKLINSVDKLVYTEDVESFVVKDSKQNNLHRQILTTKEGLNHCSYDRVIKIRSDLLIEKPRVLVSFLYKAIASKRIGCISYSTVDPVRNRLPLYYHVCDWIYAGSLSNIKVMFSCPLPELEYFYKYEGCTNRGRLSGYCEAVRAESYICSFVYSRLYWEEQNTDTNISKFRAIKSNFILSRNFLIESISDIGLRSMKHKTNNFDPNRFSKVAMILWSRVSSKRSSGLFWKVILRLYYCQNYLYFFLREIKGYLKNE